MAIFWTFALLAADFSDEDPFRTPWHGTKWASYVAIEKLRNAVHIPVLPKSPRFVAAVLLPALLLLWPLPVSMAATVLRITDQPVLSDTNRPLNDLTPVTIQYQLMAESVENDRAEDTRSDRVTKEPNAEQGNGESTKPSETKGEEKPESEERETRYPGESLKLEAAFGDGFGLASKDEEFELRIHVLNQVDYKSFRPPGQDPAAHNGVYLPRTRIYFEGKLTDPFRYEVSVQRSNEGVFDLLDANLDVRFAQQFQMRFGRTLIPYSYTWYDHLEQYFIVPERPLFPLNFGLSRAAGVQLWGEDDLRRWQYSVGWYDGRVAGLADNNTTSDAVGYINLRPFAVRGMGGPWENLNFGGSLVVGENKRPAELLPGRTSVQTSENDEAANAASAIFLEFNPDAVGFGDRLLGAIHGAWYGGPISIETEWNMLRNEVFNEDTATFVSVPASGFHVTFATFLTGERVRCREAVQPLRPFDPRHGCPSPGAWEPFVRFSYLRIGNELFDRDLANPELWTDEVSMTDLGINWYMNRFAKFTFNWQHAMFASPVLVNEEKGRFSDTNDLFWLRCQIYF